MRKICLALCFSLFASLVHAAVMPIELPANAVANTPMIAMDASSHHCDEVVANTQGSGNQQSCHGDSYQCCLGVAFASPVVTLASQDFIETPASEYPALVLQPIINFIYKPPKA